ncbi:uncharacterized protein FOMMEDRAFT_151672 [Fomitiporia mediterranea MF3/22]|uniref:uncharacterized protein n=1 Tax=Fomitiporia mediterranea (strain MF3/22) TaxID=694068 RepID=UPI00044099B4|nr:uncharacterized protein FOMMEDRAFT_151672 [Fomitiporia mediterranea MF3/22]EJD06411.1 hypothetical protein FOMMEDRAFT_151672 [Fomitiporia mediterranea MF3/22]
MQSLSSNLVNPMQEFSQPESFPPMDLISSSGCDSFSCPSLSASSTLSSEDYTELETDQDIISPLCSPSLESTYAYDLAHALSNSMDKASLNEAGTATPRPLQFDRKGYFHGPVKVEDDGYEGGNETGRVPNLLAKRRLYSLRNRKSSILFRTSRVEQPVEEYTSDNFKVMAMACDTRGNSASQLRNARPHSSPMPVDSYDPEMEGDSIRKAVLVKTRRATQDMGLGRELPIVRNEQSMQQEGFSTKSEKPLPLNLVTDSSYVLSDGHGLGLQRAPAKAALQPMDTVLGFMDSPSPIDELPPSVIFEWNVASLEENVPILQGRSISPCASRSIVGLGIDILDRSTSVAEAGSSSPLGCEEHYS